MTIVEPSEWFPFYLRHYQDGGEYKFEAYCISGSHTTNGVTRYSYTLADESDSTDDVALATPNVTAVGEMGKITLNVTMKSYFMSVGGLESFHQLTARMLDVMFDMCPKVKCAMCTSQHYAFNAELDAGTDFEQGDGCAVWWDHKTKMFDGGYGSNKFDMHCLVPVDDVAFGDGMARGPYCDTCVGNWVDNGLVTVKRDPRQPEPPG